MMADVTTPMSEAQGCAEALGIFEREVGATGIAARVTSAGHTSFLKFVVGRDAPIYQHALRETQKALSEGNPFRGALGIIVQKCERFPDSLEAGVIQTLLTRSTRSVSQNEEPNGFSVPYVPFQNREDHQLAQPASHVVVGRRGVGKSTLINRAAEIIRATNAVIAILDVQKYSLLSGQDLTREILHDVANALMEDAVRVSDRIGRDIDVASLAELRDDLLAERISPEKAAPRLNRALANVTRFTKSNAFVFLDDYHLLGFEDQPKVLHLIHAALKGANGWLKVAGLRSLLNYYSAQSRLGLQVPGDAQLVPLDLTLENPERAESHLKAILEGFLNAVGYSVSGSVLPQAAFRRLAWANAGVPRDFLQMFGRAIDHARRNKHTVVTLTDVNASIGESGQRKMDELAQDARNSQGELLSTLGAIEALCLENEKTNAFLVRSENSDIRQRVHVLSDLRLVHLINQSITPDRAGERYEAYIVDYSLFTGFRRRPNVREMVPEAGQGQFKASQLRGLPKISADALAKMEV
jgi:energy-coupling factor transporter ATP-binding protein EcfA2